MDIYGIYFLTFYSGILFGILSRQSILAFYLASILTSYLASFLASILIFSLHSFCYSIWHRFWHSFWHSFRHSFWHSILFWHPLWHGHCPLGLARPAAHWDLALAVEVQQCPLRSAARRWGPAAPTEIWSSQLRSGSAHWDIWDLEFAVGGRRKEGGKEEERNPKKNYRGPHRPSPGRWGNMLELCSHDLTFLVYNVFSFHVSAVYKGHKKFQ